jgi:TonB-linked SusC/RagA family outer membrane protein
MGNCCHLLNMGHVMLHKILHAMRFLTKTTLMEIVLLMMFFTKSFSQEKIITGSVHDKTGLGISGATVMSAVSKRSVVTDNVGNFKIGITGEDNALTISSVGYFTQTFSLSALVVFDFILKDDPKSLTEVVVTAYGIKKEAKRLGYTVQEIKGADLVKARDANPINSLAGKVAGLSVGASAELLGRPELVLRGSKDLLFVVDGAPINSDTWNISPDDIETYSVLKGPNAAALYGSRGINGAIVITLKKGSRDKKGWQVDVNSSTLFERGFIAAPKAQTEYGRGNGYHYEYQAKDGGNLYAPQADVLYDNANRLGEFGPRFEGQLLRQYDSPYDLTTGIRTPTPWTARGKDNFKNFVQTGLITTNNIAVSASGSNYNIRMSYTHLYQKGMFPNTKLNSDNLNINTSYNITPKLSLEGNMNLNIQYTPNIPDVSYGPNSYMYMFKVYGSADYDVRDLKDIYKGPQGVQDLVQYAQEYGRLNSPWFMAKKWLRSHDKTDIYAYLKLNYKINNNLNLSLRSQITTWNQKRTEQVPSSANLNAYTPWYKFGWYGDYREDNRQLIENNTDLTLSYNKRISKWSVSALLGANSRSFKYNSNYGTTRALAIPNIYVLSNSLQPSLNYSWDSKMQVYSGFYSFDVGYDKYFNINTTGRVDDLSTLPKGSRTFFYPSVSLSSVLSDYINLPRAISFFKLRGSVAEVKGALTQASIGTAYQQVTGISTSTLLNYGTELISSYDGPSYANQNTAAYASYYNNSASVAYSNVLADPKLKPFSRLSYEAGAEIKFLKNRIGLDLTWFDTKNGPQIYPKGVAPSTTYTQQNVNGITTKRTGIEIALSGSPVRNPTGFSWDISLNYATFKETLSEIYGTDQVLPLFNHNYQIGDRLDETFGTKFLRDPSGNIVYAGGTLLKAAGDNSQRLGSLGYLNPDFTFGINNKFSYKNFSFSFQFDGRVGGKIYDYNYYATMQGGTDLSTVQGVLGDARLKEWQSTAVGTKAPTPALIGNEYGAGVVIASGTPTYKDGQISNYKDLTFAANTTPGLVQSYLSGGLKANFDEYFMISRTFVKLREVTLGYSLPQKFLKRGIVKGATISLVGRNLLYFAARKDFDIDQYASGFNASDRTTGGDAAGGALQSTTARRFGFNINVSF